MSKSGRVVDEVDDPNGSCLFAAGLPADIAGSQNFQTFSTRKHHILAIDEAS